MGPPDILDARTGLTLGAAGGAEVRVLAQACARREGGRAASALLAAAALRSLGPERADALVVAVRAAELDLTRERAGAGAGAGGVAVDNGCGVARTSVRDDPRRP